MKTTAGSVARNAMTRRSGRTAPHSRRRLRIEHLEVRRLLAAGDLDTSYGVSGFAKTLMPGSGADFATDAVTQPDGKIVAFGGTFDLGLGTFAAALARYTDDGALDATFGAGGLSIVPLTGVNAAASGIALAGDGKILATGTINGDIFITRMNGDGSLDTTFGTAGLLTNDLGGNDFPSSIVVQADGKFVVVATSFHGVTGEPSPFVLRFDADGTLDPGFGGDGIVSELGAIDTNSDVALTGTQILVAGIADGQMAVALLNADGELDSTFGTGGVATADFGTPSFAASIAVQGDGMVVVSGGAGPTQAAAIIALARFDTAGVLDPAFDGDGLVVTTADATAGRVLIQPDGRILVAINEQFSSAPDRNFVIGRYDVDGSLDETFGTGGFAAADLFDSEGALAVVLTTDLRPIAVGFSALPTSNEFALVGFETDGSVDAEFGESGITTTDCPGHSLAIAVDVLLDDAGRAIVVGTDLLSGYLVRYTPEGALDTTYGVAGITRFDAGPFSRVSGAHLTDDGKLVVAGSVLVGTTTTQAFVARFDANGVLDPTFGDAGIALLPDTLVDSSDFSDVVALADGRVVAAGASPDSAIVVKFQSDGTLDTGFDGDGVALVGIAGDAADAIVDLAGGGLAVAGNRASDNVFVARLADDGSLDAGFGVGGIAVFGFNGTDDTLNALVVQADGKLLVAGSALLAAGSAVAVAQLEADGDLDATFAGDGAVEISVPGLKARADDLALDDVGRVIVAGSGSVAGTGSDDNWVVLRFESNGALDVDFAGDGIAITPMSVLAFVGGVALQADGKILVGGDIDGRLAVGRYLVEDIVVEMSPDTIGGYNAASGVFFLRTANAPGPANITFGYGPASPSIVSLVGDWDGDGDDTVGIYNSDTGAFFLRNSNSAGPADVVFVFGAGGRAPLVGDWDGDGDDTIGLYDSSNGAIFLRNGNAAGPADNTFFFGPGGPDIRPIIGDYDGNGSATIGIYHAPSGTFFIKNTNSSGPADSAFTFGPGGAGWQPLIGDWDDDGDETVGAYDPTNGVYFLRNANAPGAADVVVGYGPVSTSWRPIVGAWVVTTGPAGAAAFSSSDSGASSGAFGDEFDFVYAFLLDAKEAAERHADELREAHAAAIDELDNGIAGLLDLFEQ